MKKSDMAEVYKWIFRGLEDKFVWDYYTERLMSVERHLEKSINHHYYHLATKQLKRHPFEFKSSQIHLREDLIIWLMNTSDKLLFNVSVKHLAVYLLDIFLDNHKVLSAHLKMAASCCLILAAKVEDNGDPMNKKFNKILGGKYELREFVRMEMCILEFFKFNVMHVTVVDFMEIFSVFAVHPTDKRYGKFMDDFEIVTRFVKQYIAYFMDKIILDPTYYLFAPALVAAAIILTTRQCLMLTPTWPLVLAQFTGYTHEDILQCSDLLRRSLNGDTIYSITSRAFDSVIANCCNVVCRPLSSPSSSSDDSETTPKSE